MAPFDLSDIPPELLRALLDNPYESQILVDKQGVVRFLSSHSEDLYGMTQAEAVGRQVRDLNPESQLPRVLRSGRAEIGQLLRMRGKERLVARLPLRDNEGRVIGAVGKLMSWHPQKIAKMARQLELLESRLSYYEQELRHLYRSRYTLDRYLGESKKVQDLRRAAAQAAASDLPVLITGETGTGKEILAHAIHQLSNRRDKALVRVNCASIPQELFESELFGYEGGAFTGAKRQGKPGKFELAQGGTIFLDEVGELPVAMQVKLLRVIQEGEVERVGGTRPLRLDFRVIAATNRDLRDMISAGGFRDDLFYRLNIFPLRPPGLREIAEDIPRLAYHILSQLKQRQGKAPKRIAPEAMEILTAYQWPGNVRELQNVLERAAVEAGEEAILAEHLPPEVRGAPRQAAPAPRELESLRQEMARYERRVLERALSLAQGNRTRAAGLLGIHRTGLYQKLKRHGLEGKEGS
ncbi:MAG: sigma 54-interacting transcriptional regulator [Desulfarculus sp.]|nr:sigma 54-interacting transcriptional regulator [Desulfarculus sp.]